MQLSQDAALTAVSLSQDAQHSHESQADTLDSETV